MHVDDIGNLQALGFVILLIAGAALLFHLLPAGPRVILPPRRYSDDEIRAGDGALPKYFLAGAIALVLGGVHAVLKSLPPARDWLLESGYAGHMVRDLSNTHLIIVIGGTITATGLTWYVLPRVVGRPLWSNALAGFSFWATVAGAGSFYLAHLSIGLVVGAMAHGWTSPDALHTLALVNDWGPVVLGVGAATMGVGYWTFVADVLLTIHAARRLPERAPDHHLAKFFAVGALGLFAGTVQGVIQVQPDNVLWLHAAGRAGRYVDPIAHAHVNLVTGTLSLIAGIAFYFARPATAEWVAPPRIRRSTDRVFWVLVPGSVAFFVSFLTLGLVAGQRVVDGVSFTQVVRDLGVWHWLPLSLAGTWTLAGVWLLLLALWRSFRDAPGDAPRPATAIRVAALVLALGTLQGILQLSPPAQQLLHASGWRGSVIVNAHAQLNLLGGILLALVGLAMVRGEALWGADVPVRQGRGIAVAMGSGAVLYWLGALTTVALASVHPDPSAADFGVPVGGPLLSTLGALLFTGGASRYGLLVWRATAPYRARGWSAIWSAAARYDGSAPAWRTGLRPHSFVAAEAAAAAVGFPGLGWLLSGRAAVGLSLALTGPGIAWGVLPLLMSPFGTSALRHQGIIPMVAYLVATTAASAGVLAWTLRSGRRAAVGTVPLTVGD